MVADALAPTTRAAHDIGLAAWLDGSMPGNFAPNPSLEKRLQPHDRRSVSMAARSGYNRIDALGQGATAGRAARALTEGPQHCSPGQMSVYGSLAARRARPVPPAPTDLAQ